MPQIVIAGIELIAPVIGAESAAFIGNVGLFLTSGVVGGAVLSVGLSYAVKAIEGKPSSASAGDPTAQQGWRGDSLQVSLSSSDPRKVALGQTSTAGTFITWQTWTEDASRPNEWLLLVFRLADHKCEALVGGWWNGNTVTINEDGSIQEAFADGQQNLWVTFHDGDWNQDADSDMVAWSDGRWTTDDRGRGVAYVTVKARYNETAFPQGLSSLFQFQWVIKGARLFDRRLSTAEGGDGPQVPNDAGSYTWSDNLAVAAENILRGISAEDTSAPIETRARDAFFGLNLAAAVLSFADNVAAMNLCDEDVGLKAGGAEKRYRVAGMISCDSTVEQVLSDLMTACAGKLLTAPGRWAILPGAARTSVRTIQDGDLRIDGPRTYSPDTPFDEVINAVYGSFADPAFQYAVTPLPPRLNASDEVADRGRKSATYQLNFVASQGQGQRVMEIFRRRARKQKTATLTMPPIGLVLEAGDWITRVSSRPGFLALMEIVSGSISLASDDFLQLTLNLQEEATATYAWDPSTDELDRPEVTPLPSGSLAGVEPTGFAVAPTTISGSTGSAPALNLTWDTVADPASVGVKFEWRIVGTADGTNTFSRALDLNPSAGVASATVQEGVVGAASYEARMAIRYQPARADVWTSWTAASGPTAGVSVDHSSTSDHATSATSAETADTAGHADTADSATHADSAGSLDPP